MAGLQVVTMASVSVTKATHERQHRLLLQIDGGLDLALEPLAAYI